MAIPISKHKARGTFRKARHGGKLEPTGGRLGAAPEYFNEVQRAEWDRLAAIEHIRADARATVEHACILYTRFVADAKGEKAMQASERQTFHSVYMQLGLTPASAGKVQVAPAQKADDVWAKLG